MSRKGQPTRLAERVEIGERWQTGQNDREIAQALQRPRATVRKWRRRYQRQGRAGLSSTIGRPRAGALRQAHPGWGPLTLLTELQHEPRFADERLPSRARIAAYLAQRRWFRLTSPQGLFSLGHQRYNARTSFAKQTLEITFDPLSCQLICCPRMVPLLSVCRSWA